MDRISSLPRSFKGNTELLLWVDIFSGYVIAKASSSRTAQTIAEDYENVSYGGSVRVRQSVAIESLGSCQIFPSVQSDFKAEAARYYGIRPQINGTAERMMQTLTRALKMYVTDVNQKDWNDKAERLTLALTTSQDLVRGDTPFYLIHGWDLRSTLEALLPLGSTKRRDMTPQRWRYHIQSRYQCARAVVNNRLKPRSRIELNDIMRIQICWYRPRAASVALYDSSKRWICP